MCVFYVEHLIACHFLCGQDVNYGVKKLYKKGGMQIDPTGSLDNILCCFTDSIT